jgi:hypothetical protein
VIGTSSSLAPGVENGATPIDTTAVISIRSFGFDEMACGISRAHAEVSLQYHCATPGDQIEPLTSCSKLEPLASHNPPRTVVGVTCRPGPIEAIVHYFERGKMIEIEGAEISLK